jgi:hypothetical protein
MPTSYLLGRFPAGTENSAPLTHRRAHRHTSWHSAVLCGPTPRWRALLGMPCRLFANLRIHLGINSSNVRSCEMLTLRSAVRLELRPLCPSEFVPVGHRPLRKPASVFMMHLGTSQDRLRSSRQPQMRLRETGAPIYRNSVAIEGGQKTPGNRVSCRNQRSRKSIANKGRLLPGKHRNHPSMIPQPLLSVRIGK